MMALLKAEKGEDALIRIESEAGSSMGQLHAIQSLLCDLELGRIVYSGELGDAIPMMLPPANAKAHLAALPEDQLLRVKVDGEGVVSRAIGRSPHLVVVLDTDNDTSYGAFVQVLSSIKQAGAVRIAIGDPAR